MALIFSLLDEGISEGDLLDHVAGAAELVRRGRESARWWSVHNLFGPKNVDVWRANIEEMRDRDRIIADREAHERRRDEEHRREAQLADKARRAAPVRQLNDFEYAHRDTLQSALAAVRSWGSDEGRADDADHG